ncbi:MAG: efflux RND transporter periplasmic adaptor subunit [Flavobacteriaceae bacterium]|jgi:RND family efflux transporter MFP subunit|nr:efflux RND transporter periplasmic adaptor subunit [Flavobacteriaceae bacterium]
MKTVKPLLIIVAVIAVLGWAVMTIMNNKKKSEEETQIVSQTNESVAVNIARIKYEFINTEYTANGTLIPFQELMFPSEISGKIVKIFVDEGSSVRIGQTLAIVRGDQRSVNLTAAQAVYQNALTDNQRYENAFRTGGVTQQQLDASRLNLKNAKAQLDLAQINVGDTHIKATINGIVNARYVEPGSVVSPGTQLFDIVNVSTLKLKAEVDESLVTTLKLGDEVKVTASVFPDKEFFGKITFIAPKASSSMNFPVEIQISNHSENLLKAGMYCTATFTSSTKDKKQNIMVIPREAFVGGLKNNQVFVVKNGVAYLTKIVSGRNFGDKIEVLGGLKNGDAVVTSGQINVSDGVKVKIIK